MTSILNKLKGYNSPQASQSAVTANYTQEYTSKK